MQVRERWDGRTWFVRVAAAGVAVVAAGLVPGVDERAFVQVAAVTGLVWIPLVAVAERARLARPASLTTLVSTLVDLAALVVLDQLAPALAPVLLVLVLPTGVLHVQRLDRIGRVLVGLAALTAQAAIAVDGLPALVWTMLVPLDVVAVLITTRNLGETDRRWRQSRTALDRAGQLTDAVLAGVGEAVVVTDGNGSITSVNDAAEVTFGQPVGGGCARSLGLRRGASVLDCSGGCPLLADGDDVAQVDVRRDHPSGTTQALLVNVRALRDPLGRVREVVHSYRDVTRMKQAEQAKTLFLATASHELKTPLAVMTGFASLLADGGLDEERRAVAIRTILDRGAQLTGIIDRLLLASRIDGGGVALTTQPVDAAEVLRDRVGALLEVTGRTIHLDLPDGRVPRVEADGTALATVVDHLVENAVKYSPDGGTVTVALAVHDETVEVDVIDRGVGMSSDQAADCFEPFWQAESADTRRFGGSGVGLYIVRSLSRAMGGETTVLASAPGVGTTFRLRLRRTDAVVARDDAGDRDGQPATMVHDVMRQMGVAGNG